MRAQALPSPWQRRSAYRKPTEHLTASPTPSRGPVDNTGVDLAPAERPGARAPRTDRYRSWRPTSAGAPASAGARRAETGRLPSAGGQGWPDMRWPFGLGQVGEQGFPEQETGLAGEGSAAAGTADVRVHHGRLVAVLDGLGSARPRRLVAQLLRDGPRLVDLQAGCPFGESLPPSHLPASRPDTYGGSALAELGAQFGGFCPDQPVTYGNAFTPGIVSRHACLWAGSIAAYTSAINVPRDGVSLRVIAPGSH